jgi:PhnB protein
MAEGVKSVPEGYHTVTPHLVIRGAAEAIEFYKRAFGAVELMRMAMPDGKVSHAEIRIGDSPVMISDEFPEWGSVSPQSLGGCPGGVFLYVDNVDEVFDRAVGAGAEVKMAVADQFWGDRFGKVVDPYGHLWAIATHVEDLTPDEISARAAQFMAQAAGGADA